ncbi:uncharacterized protein BP01DRAFT_361242 [Aspergillus saccharolyticus JOP 1030-1]|uniref:N-acetyltransferase domain-containing protein n=1 Tax=Aspergillus saccharolyticus JOP 1030-1 TaxID=1450539 RepID=A0A318ZJL7_9EURO|nr:hypothetical protein BP01DRAFT_361242 [Aspergillus saccharolyticus JOP 1030-1]PYH40458.1 hypothetical protein BP01DRAFT_361242 [Aspergillus saccharolyticus JOP 1030-1]
MSLPTDPKQWVKERFLISTDKNLLSPTAINHAFAQDCLYWANPVPEEVLRSLIENSFCFGLYQVNAPPFQDGDHHDAALQKPDAAHVEQIGFARLITDGVTFAYLTDLYVLPEYQGHGLGGWLIDCVDEGSPSVAALAVVHVADLGCEEPSLLRESAGDGGPRVGGY